MFHKSLLILLGSSLPNIMYYLHLHSNWEMVNEHLGKCAESVTYKRSKSSPEAPCSYLSRVPFYLKVSILEYAKLKISSCKRV